MKKIIACVLSVTLVLNPVLAYADEASTDGLENVAEPSFEITSPVPDEEQIYYPDLEGGVSDGGVSLDFSSNQSGVSYGLSRGVEEPEVDITEPLPDLPERGEVDDSISSPDALPAALVWLVRVGVSTTVAYSIKSLLSSGSSEEVSLLYGILEALVEDDYTAAEYLQYIERYTQASMAHLNNIYYLLTYTNSSGYTYGIDTIVYNIWDILYRMEFSLIDVRDLLHNFFTYTNSKGYTYDLAAMLYDIWDTLYRMEAVDSQVSNLLQDYLKYTNSSGYTYDLAYMVYQIWDILYYMDSGGSSSENPRFPGLDDLITAVRDIYDLLDSGDFSSGSDNPASSFDFFELLFGALEFGLIATSLADLGDELTTTFPFSLVAGFVAIIGLFQASPVAPCFDFPMPDGAGGQIIVTVDLSVFDEVAAVCRVVMTIIFIIGLIGVTRNFIYKGGSSE